MSARPFPLDAEQIVRGVAWLARLWLNRTRCPGDGEVGLDTVTLALGEAVGVPLPTREIPISGLVAGTGTRTVLLPYGNPSESGTLTPSSRSGPATGDDARSGVAAAERHDDAAEARFRTTPTEDGRIKLELLRLSTQEGGCSVLSYGEVERLIGTLRGALKIKRLRAQIADAQQELDRALASQEWH